jgi:hypothetical protein
VHRVGPVLLTSAVLCCTGTAAGAQEVTILYGIRSNQGVERVPVNPPYHYRIAPRLDSAPGAGVRIIEVTREPAGQGFATVRPWQRGNPLVDLLSDPTLRPGDIAMFADGPRVFTGAPHGRRELSDFAPVASGARLLPPAVRDQVSRLRPGWSDTWVGIAGAAPAQPDRRAAALAPGFEIVRVSPPR